MIIKCECGNQFPLELFKDTYVYAICRVCNKMEIIKPEDITGNKDTIEEARKYFEDRN